MKLHVRVVNLGSDTHWGIACYLFIYEPFVQSAFESVEGELELQEASNFCKTERNYSCWQLHSPDFSVLHLASQTVTFNYVFVLLSQWSARSKSNLVICYNANYKDVISKSIKLPFFCRRRFLPIEKCLCKLNCSECGEGQEINERAGRLEGFVIRDYR